MESIGSFALCLALVLVVYAVAASIVSARTGKERLQYSAYRAVAAVFGLVTVAAGILLYGLLTSDFRLAAVAYLQQWPPAVAKMRVNA